jgi:hypothetical protein
MDQGVRNRVVNAAPLASSTQQTGMVKPLQMAGDIRLIAVELCHHLTNRAWAFFKGLQNAQTLWLSQGAETAGYLLDHRIR